MAGSIPLAGEHQEPKEAEPLIERQPAGWAVDIESKIATESTNLPAREARSQAARDRVASSTERGRHEAPIRVGLGCVDERPDASSDPQDDGVHLWTRMEIGALEPAHDLDLPPRLQLQRPLGLGGERRSGESLGGLTLHDQPDVVGRASGEDGGEAFVWDGVHGMRSLRELLVDGHGLDLTGWELAGASGVSGDGTTIVGYEFMVIANSEALPSESWIAFVPEPSEAILCATALALVAGLARPRRRSST